MNKTIKAAFFDIDGTLLLFDSHDMPNSTVQALHKLQANGVKIFIATGRPPVHLPHLPALKKVDWDGYVTMNGQYCFMADGEVIYSQAIASASISLTTPCAPCCRILRKKRFLAALWKRTPATLT